MRLAPGFLDRLAAWRVRRGMRLLGTGARVVTDRLHAHILCLLLGIPHTTLDNSYGKLSTFIGTWTTGLCDVSWAAPPATSIDPRPESEADPSDR
jgi:pyruvyl transferase EpsO